LAGFWKDKGESCFSSFPTVFILITADADVAEDRSLESSLFAYGNYFRTHTACSDLVPVPDPVCLLNGFLFVVFVGELSERSGRMQLLVHMPWNLSVEWLPDPCEPVHTEISGMFMALRILLIVNLVVCILYSISCESEFKSLS